MSPTYKSGDYLLVRSLKSSYVPKRGDVVVATHQSITYLKRVIGLPKEEITLNDGILMVDGEHLLEPYLGGLPAHLGLGKDSWMAGEGQVFLMGDNRTHSEDSRTFGPVESTQLQGRVISRLWPLGRRK